MSYSYWRGTYLSYMALWPGAALASVQFLPVVQNSWIGKLDDSLLIFVYIGILAASACYWAVLIEGVEFPRQLSSAVTLTLALPIHLGLMLLTGQSIWTTLFLGCCMEITVVLIAISVLVIKKMTGADKNWSAAAILLTTTIGFGVIVWPSVTQLIGTNWLTWTVTASGVITGTIQNLLYLKQPAGYKLGDERYVFIGVAGLVLFPVAALVWQLL